MEKIKIKDLALEISVDIKDIISKCKDLSIVARSSSSSVAREDAEKIKSSFSNRKIDSTKSERDIVKNFLRNIIDFIVFNGLYYSSIL